MNDLITKKYTSSDPAWSKLNFANKSFKMKTAISITISILIVGFSQATILKEIRSANEECCKAAYPDDVDSQRNCLKAIERQLSHSHVAHVFSKSFEKVTDDVEKQKIDEFAKAPQFASRFNGLTDQEQVMDLRDEIYVANENTIENAVEAAKKPIVESMKDVAKQVCNKISEIIAGENDADLFSTQLFGFIFASGIGQFQMEDWSPFIKYVEKNKGDIEDTRADLWQRMYTLDKNMVDFVSKCNCKDIVFSPEFRTFLRWILVKKSRNDSFKLCSLEKTVDIYKRLSNVINEDLEENDDIILKEMKKC